MSSDPKWNVNCKTRIIDEETGEEIGHVVWCNTSTGELCRLQEDENGLILAVDGPGVASTEEVRNIRVEYEKEQGK